MQVLIVDDHELAARTCACMIRSAGCTVDIALSAQQALAAVRVHTPDAILLDLHMPLMDGLEFLRSLRGMDQCRSTPVAIVTGDYFIEDGTLTELRGLGAFICLKPLWLEDCAALLQTLLQRGGPS